MSIKLFVEMGKPQRCIMVMDTTDMLECKAETASFNYDSKTFSGTLRVKDVPWERLEHNIIQKIKDSINFPDVATAQQFLDKLFAVVPEFKPDDPRKITEEIISAEMKSIAKEADANDKRRIGFIKGPVNHQSLKEIEGHVWEIENVQAVLNQIESVSQPLKVEKKEVKIQPHEPIQNQPVKQPNSKQKRQLKRVQNGQKEQVKHENIKANFDTGFIKTFLSEYPKGFIIGHKFFIKEEGQLLIVSTPKLNDDWESSFPMVFAQEKQATFVLEALLRHPRLHKIVGKAVVLPVDDIIEEQRHMEAALITNALTFVNSLDKL